MTTGKRRLGIVLTDFTHSRLVEMGEPSGIPPAKVAEILLAAAVTDREPGEGWGIEETAHETRKAVTP